MTSNVHLIVVGSLSQITLVIFTWRHADANYTLNVFEDFELHTMLSVSELNYSSNDIELLDIGDKVPRNFDIYHEGFIAGYERSYSNCNFDFDISWTVIIISAINNDNESTITIEPNNNDTYLLDESDLILHITTDSFFCGNAYNLIVELECRDNIMFGCCLTNKNNKMMSPATSETVNEYVRVLDAAAFSYDSDSRDNDFVFGWLCTKHETLAILTIASAMTINTSNCSDSVLFGTRNGTAAYLTTKQFTTNTATHSYDYYYEFKVTMFHGNNCDIINNTFDVLHHDIYPRSDTYAQTSISYLFFFCFVFVGLN